MRPRERETADGETDSHTVVRSRLYGRVVMASWDFDASVSVARMPQEYEAARILLHRAIRP